MNTEKIDSTDTEEKVQARAQVDPESEISRPDNLEDKQEKQPAA